MKSMYLAILSQVHLWIDIVLLNAAYLACGTFIESFSEIISDHQFLIILLVANLVWILCIYIIKPYSFTSFSYTSYSHFGKHLLAIVLHFTILEVLLNVSLYAQGNVEHLIFTSFEVFIILSVLFHMIVIEAIRSVRKSKYYIKKYAIIANGENHTWLDKLTQAHSEIGCQFCGTFPFANHSRLLERLEKFMESNQLDFIYCCLSEMSSDEVTAVLKVAERKKTQVRLIPDFEGFQNKINPSGSVDNYPIIGVNSNPLGGDQAELIKRAFDITFSVIIMVLGLPVFLAIMLMIKLSSSGSIFFLQERTGRWGHKFRIIKFRTMYMDAEKYGMQHSQGTKDPRITPVGTFLRRTRLDELPQFLNVLKGDMSVVGPRPLHHYDVEMLMNSASHQFQKTLTIRPGITSIGQIKVGYATNAAENLNRLKYDLLYLNPYSLRKDLYLILLTIQVILLRKGR